MAPHFAGVLLRNRLRKDRRSKLVLLATRWPPSRSKLPELGTRGEFHLKRRSFARRRHYPDPAAMHLDDLFGDGEAEPRAALGLGKGTVDLMELIEDPILLV